MLAKSDRVYNAAYPPNTVALIAQLREEGLGPMKIADEMIAREIPHPNGRVWNRRHIETVGKKYGIRGPRSRTAAA